MKSILTPSFNPTFTPGAAGAGTLNFASAVSSFGFSFQRLLAVINLSSNTVLFASGAPGSGGTWNNGTSTLTLATSTSGNSSGDLLEVIWDDPRASVIIDAPNPSVPVGWPSVFQLVVAATTNATSVKSSAGTLGGICFLPSEGGQIGQPGCLKIYDKASAPIVGTDTPRLIIPSCCSAYNAGQLIFPPAGLRFVNGIAIAVTYNTPITDTTAVSARTFAVNLIYA
jgi:hypothetical protein